MKRSDDEPVRNARDAAPILTLDFRQGEDRLDEEIKDLLRSKLGYSHEGVAHINWEVDPLGSDGHASGWVYRNTAVLARLVHYPRHTPGPWRIQRTDASDRRTHKLKGVEFRIEPVLGYPRKERELWEGQGGPPAFTIARVPFDSGCQGDALANARVMNAAPELLAALIRLERACARPALRDAVVAACVEARSAIRKAFEGDDAATETEAASNG